MPPFFNRGYVQQASDDLAVVVAPMQAEHRLIVWDAIGNEAGFAGVAKLTRAGYTFALRAAAENITESGSEDGGFFLRFRCPFSIVGIDFLFRFRCSQDL
jgi:hypothetical protein